MLFEESELKTKTKQVISIISWIFLTLSFFLAAVVAVAQSSVPGDDTYPIKQGFEKTVLVGFSLFNLDSSYQIDLTALRFDETKKIIKTDHAYLGFEKLLEQMFNTEYSIYTEKNLKKKTELANQYIATLTNISYQLEQEKKTIIEETSLPKAGRTTAIVPSTPNDTNTANTTNNITYTKEQVDEMLRRVAELASQEQHDDENDFSNGDTPWRPTETPTPLPTSPPPTAIPPILFYDRQGSPKILPNELQDSSSSSEVNNEAVTPTVYPTTSE